MPDSIRVVAHIHAHPGQEDAVRGVLETFLVPTRAEAGCLAYDFFVDADNPSRFTFIEEWTSRDALNAHLQTPHLQAGVTAMDGKLVDEPWIQVLRSR